MSNVREIDGLIAIVSVIRPGAANESKKLSFTRRYQGTEPAYYLHSCLEPCLKNTFGLVVYENTFCRSPKNSPDSPPVVLMYCAAHLWPNQSPEPTAVGAVSSAIAVHVASRRWLSFFR
jgi:hypothetical protein